MASVTIAERASLEATGTAPPPASSRKQAIDLIRGGIMLLMALDHARFFVSDARFAPEDMQHTYPALFLTRWVTHFCAPLFFLLAGASAWLSSRQSEPGAVPRHLLARGLLLIVLELTIVGFGWSFTPGYSFGGVLWALGWSMIVLALVRGIPARWLAAAALVVIAGHDLLAGIDPASLGAAEPLWRILHVPGPIAVAGREWFVLWALVPWSAVMALGYACGGIWELAPARRQRLLMLVGSSAFALFVVLRGTHAYGNPPGASGGGLAFRVHDEPLMTLVSLLNVEKYPGSLQFVLMTLGAGLVALALAERAETRPASRARAALATFGRVPMFYYVTHLYVVHLLALALAVASGQSWQWLGWRGPASPPAGYGHGLPAVYAVWALAVVLLWFPCRRVDVLKRTRRRTWLRYV